MANLGVEFPLGFGTRKRLFPTPFVESFLVRHTSHLLRRKCNPAVFFFPPNISVRKSVEEHKENMQSVKKATHRGKYRNLSAPLSKCVVLNFLMNQKTKPRNNFCFLPCALSVSLKMFLVERRSWEERRVQKNVDLLFNELRTINFHNSKQCAERRLVFIRKIWIEDEKKVERRGDLHKTNAFSKDLPTSVNLSEMSVPFFP